MAVCFWWEASNQGEGTSVDMCRNFPQETQLLTALSCVFISIYDFILLLGLGFYWC